MLSFLKFILREQTEKHHVLFWGRVNPPTAGHEQAYNTVKSEMKNNNASGSMILSRSHDAKNPLTPEQKQTHAQHAFPGVNVSVANAEHPTILHQLSKLHDSGVTHLTMVAGSDRIPEYNKLINNYNGKEGAHGLYNFKQIKFKSSGERDPDAEGVEGVSGTSQRKHAENNDFESFKKGAPSTMKPKHVKQLFDDVRTGLENAPKPKKKK